MGYVIGIDVGSQSVKAGLFDDAGTSVAEASAPCEMRHPCSGWAEQDPADWERGIARAVRELRERGRVRASDVEVLALACQVDGLVAVDERLRAVRPAIIWLDRRATEQSDRLSDAVGEDELIIRTGLNPDASHTAPKAMWLRDEEPEQYGAARWLAPVGGHLAGWLTGEVVEDPANASSTLLYDLRSGDWDAYRPTFVVIEALSTSFARIPADPAVRFLTDLGYEPRFRLFNSVVLSAGRT